MKTFFKLFIFGAFVISLGSCTLDVQDSFDFNPENTFSDPFANMTAWEYIQTRTSPGLVDEQNRKRLNGEELDLMAAAIRKVGYERFFNSRSTSNRTFLLLNNNAFAGGNQARSIMRVISGRNYQTTQRVNADSLMATVTEPDQINRLKAILKYHIVTTKVAQVPTLPERDRDFLFKTLLPTVLEDVDNQPVRLLPNTFADIAFRRNIEWNMRVNEVASPLPAFATGSGGNERVRRHNYVFSNGIGHYLNDPVVYQPYSHYNNFSVD